MTPKLTPAYTVHTPSGHRGGGRETYTKCENFGDRADMQTRTPVATQEYSFHTLKDMVENAVPIEDGSVFY